jgi:hypothetical protein
MAIAATACRIDGRGAPVNARLRGAGKPRQYFRASPTDREPAGQCERVGTDVNTSQLKAFLLASKKETMNTHHGCGEWTSVPTLPPKSLDAADCFRSRHRPRMGSGYNLSAESGG